MVSIRNKLRGGIITLICLYVIVSFRSAFCSPSDRETILGTQAASNDGQVTSATTTPTSQTTSTASAESAQSPADDGQTTPATQTPAVDEHGTQPNLRAQYGDEQAAPTTSSQGGGQASESAAPTREPSPTAPANLPPSTQYIQSLADYIQASVDESSIVTEVFQLIRLGGMSRTAEERYIPPLPSPTFGERQVMAAMQIYLHSQDVVEELSELERETAVLSSLMKRIEDLFSHADSGHSADRTKADAYPTYLTLKQKVDELAPEVRQYVNALRILKSYDDTLHHLRHSRSTLRGTGRWEAQRLGLACIFAHCVSHMNADRESNIFDKVSDLRNQASELYKHHRR